MMPVSAPSCSLRPVGADATDHGVRRGVRRPVAPQRLSDVPGEMRNARARERLGAMLGEDFLDR
jgi:hypothetical protein